MPALPHRAHVLGLAQALRVDYETDLLAMLHDAKYLPESVARAEQSRLDEEDRQNWIEIRDLVVRLLREAEGDVQEAIQLANQHVHNVHPSKRTGGAHSGTYLNAREYLKGELEFPAWLSAEHIHPAGETDEDLGNLVVLDVEQHQQVEGDDQLETATRRGSRSRAITDQAQNLAGEESRDDGV